MLESVLTTALLASAAARLLSLEFVERFIEKRLRKEAGEHDYSEAVSLDLPTGYTPDVILRTPKGRALVVEIKDQVRSADIARLSAAGSAVPDAKTVLLSNTDAPQDLKDYALTQGVTIVEGWDKVAQVLDDSED